MANNEKTMENHIRENHIRKMNRPFVWATQVEIYAASSFFQVPLYILHYTSQTDYHWEVTKPIKKEKLRFPLLEDSTDEDFPQPTNQLSHLELAYLTNTHYDSIVDVKSGCPIASYPGSLIIAGEEKRAWFQSLAHALNLTC